MHRIRNEIHKFLQLPRFCENDVAVLGIKWKECEMELAIEFKMILSLVENWVFLSCIIRYWFQDVFGGSGVVSPSLHHHCGLVVHPDPLMTVRVFKIDGRDKYFLCFILLEDVEIFIF